MKQLILTFFAVILCYSLFFDRDKKIYNVDEINYIQKGAAVVPNHKTIPDTLNYLALYNVEAESWFYYNPHSEMPKNTFVPNL